MRTHGTSKKKLALKKQTLAQLTLAQVGAAAGGLTYRCANTSYCGGTCTSYLGCG